MAAESRRAIIAHIRQTSPLESPTINYVVLALAKVFESVSFSIAWKAFRRTKGSRRTLTAIHHGKDPSLFTVLLKETAALLGLVVAFIRGPFPEASRVFIEVEVPAGTGHPVKPESTSVGAALD